MRHEWQCDVTWSPAARTAAAGRISSSAATPCPGPRRLGSKPRSLQADATLSTNVRRIFCKHLLVCTISMRKGMKYFFYYIEVQ